MSHVFLPSRFVVGVLALAAALTVLPTAAWAAEYVLMSGQWGDKQTSAVEAAGGTVLWSHAATGLGAVSSDAPGFLDAVGATSAFTATAQDFLVQWQPDVPEQVITPDDNGFFPFQWNLQAIEAPAAWATGCTGAGVRVAINDGGIYDVHPDLEPNMDTACSISFVPGQPFNNDTGRLWHGTHVAGIVGADDGTLGLLGVAPEATLVGVKVLHSGSGTFGQVIGGILYAADPAAFGRPDCAPADIINMSLGAIFRKSTPGAGSLIGAMAKAVNFAASKDVLVVSAAGNNGLDLGQLEDFTFVPAESGSGLAVSATGPVDVANGGTNYRRPASYSNFGEGTISLAAPGGDFTLSPNGAWFLDMVLSSCRGSQPLPAFSVCFSAGTSMATPVVSGVAALIKSVHPGISLGALKAKLAQTADDEGPTGYDEFYGHGFVNAFRACTE